MARPGRFPLQFRGCTLPLQHGCQLRRFGRLRQSPGSSSGQPPVGSPPVPSSIRFGRLHIASDGQQQDDFIGSVSQLLSGASPRLFAVRFHSHPAHAAHLSSHGLVTFRDVRPSVAPAGGRLRRLLRQRRPPPLQSGTDGHGPTPTCRLSHFSAAPTAAPFQLHVSAGRYTHIAAADLPNELIHGRPPPVPLICK